MISARTLNQRRYLELLTSNAPVIVSTGPAGTGKTLLACNAGSKALAAGRVERLILTRPAVSVDEQHGFLPGTIEDKMAPWTRPMFDALYRYWSPKKVQDMMENRKIEICPLAYMRGRTFDNSWIIGDEMQNTTPNQMKMLLTRIGEGSKMILAGDVNQHDRGFEMNGLSDLVSRLDLESKSIKHITFTDDDVVRAEVIKEILKMY
jgi:phosphate starvation-inducible PhoH-like protein